MFSFIRDLGWSRIVDSIHSSGHCIKSLLFFGYRNSEFNCIIILLAFMGYTVKVRKKEKDSTEATDIYIGKQKKEKIKEYL